MLDNDKLNKFLEEGELIRWRGLPMPYGLFDATHKTTTIISLCWALLWGVFLIGGYYTLSTSRGQEIQTGVMIFCAAIPILIAWGRVSDKNKVEKLLYAVTNKRVIVIPKEGDKACAMHLAGIDDLRSEETANGNCHIRIGSATFKTSARKLQSLAYHGNFETKDDTKIYTGLVFYNVSPEDGKAICKLLLKLDVAPV